jgi:hypothetical protein
MTFLHTLAAYLQAAAYTLGTVYNAILAHEARGKPWKVAASIATALFFVLLVCSKIYGLWRGGGLISN